MNYRHIHNTDLRVSAFCYGTASFGTALSDEDAERMYAAFREAGGNFFDTAHCYGFWGRPGAGASERTLGQCLAKFGDRDKVVVATKGGHPAVGADYPRPDRYLSPEAIASDVAQSLERLGIACVDLYWLHRDDTRVPASEVVDALNAHIAAGRIRYLGASNWKVERIAEANEFACNRGLRGFVASQPQWNLAQPNSQPASNLDGRFVTGNDVVWYQSGDFAVIPYSPTACGYFATEGQAGARQFDNAVSRARLQRAQELARQLGRSPNQIALAYLLNQDFPVVPILGTTKLEHLQEALDAIPITLSLDQRCWLTAQATGRW